MRITDGRVQGAVIDLQDGDVLSGVTVKDTLIFGERGARIVGCTLVNTVIWVLENRVQIGSFDPARVGD